MTSAQTTYNIIRKSASHILKAYVQMVCKTAKKTEKILKMEKVKASKAATELVVYLRWGRHWAMPLPFALCMMQIFCL